jgi:P pilus assembly chaperone PapD
MTRLIATCMRGICVGILVLAAAVGPSHAAVVLNPVVVIEPNAREAAVRLINDRPVAIVFRMSLVNRREKPDGTWEDAGEPLPGEMFAAEFLRFSPRQVLLTPNQMQSIRILVSRPPGLPPGDYKTYLKIEELPSDETNTALAGTSPGAVAMYLIQLLPVTVRQR